MHTEPENPETLQELEADRPGGDGGVDYMQMSLTDGATPDMTS